MRADYYWDLMATIVYRSTVGLLLRMKYRDVWRIRSRLLRYYENNRTKHVILHFFSLLNAASDLHVRTCY